MSDTTQKEWNRIMSERIVGNGKPATPEPPEWIDDGPHPITPEVWKHLCDKVEQRAKEIVDEGARALDDFTARRKAKREKSDIEEFFEGSQWTADEVERLKALNEQLRQDRLLCEAMSAPLPNDPPMSARLMPWRGK